MTPSTGNLLRRCSSNSMCGAAILQPPGRRVAVLTMPPRLLPFIAIGCVPSDDAELWRNGGRRTKDLVDNGEGPLRTSSYTRPRYSPNTPRHRSSSPPTKKTVAATPKPAVSTELFEKSITKQERSHEACQKKQRETKSQGLVAEARNSIHRVLDTAYERQLAIARQPVLPVIEDDSVSETDPGSQAPASNGSSLPEN